MTPANLRELLAGATLRLEDAREELRSLDAAIGDGDLGITVADGAVAVRAALAALPADCSVADLLKAAAKAFARANPSTMGALVSMALLAAAKAVGDAPDVDRGAAVSLARAAAASIAERGSAVLGDKTVLDSLLPSITALEDSDANGADTLDAMIAAAAQGVLSTTGLQSQRGRAAWVAERSIGHADGGAVAYLRLLEALRDQWPGAPLPSPTGDKEAHR